MQDIDGIGVDQSGDEPRPQPVMDRKGIVDQEEQVLKPPGYPDPVNFDAFEGRIGFVRITIAQYMHPETLFPENLNLPAYPIITLKIVVNDDSYLFNHSTCCQIYME